MTSISPNRVRKLRATMARPRATKNSAASNSARAPASIAPTSARRGVERNESPISIDRELAFAHECPHVALLDMSRRTVEQQMLRRIRRERLRYAKRVEPQCIQAIERRTGEITARKRGELRSIGCDEPRQLDQAHIV